jgi:hypothetical protein
MPSFRALRIFNDNGRVHSAIVDTTLDELPRAFDTLMKGQARGRFVVHLAE